MTRFQKEIIGGFGDYWKKDAENRVKEYVEEATNKAVVDEDGAIKWKESGNFLMDDYCEVLEYAGYPFSREATRAKRDADLEAFAKEYRARMANYEYTEEEKYEMRAAFGEGTTVVDVISGKTIQL